MLECFSRDAWGRLYTWKLAVTAIHVLSSDVVLSKNTNDGAVEPGEEVYGRPDKNRIGTFAEFIAVSEDDLLAEDGLLPKKNAVARRLAKEKGMEETTVKRRIRKTW